jgi:hypothetical protein
MLFLQVLTNGSGFYKMDVKENISEHKRIVLRNVHTGEFIEDFTSKRKGSKANLM